MFANDVNKHAKISPKHTPPFEGAFLISWQMDDISYGSDCGCQYQSARGLLTYIYIYILFFFPSLLPLFQPRVELQSALEPKRLVHGRPL